MNEATVSTRAERHRRGMAVAAVFVAATLAFGVLFGLLPVLYDSDSYYHLAIGRTYAKAGLVDELPWARFSILRDGFGDKEVLFHLFLAPFSGGEHPERGGRWALALLNGAIFAALAALGWRALGALGLGLPLLVYAGSLDFLGRAIRLRPELFALGLLLAAVWFAGRGRYRLLGVCALLFTLSYTAFHAFLGLAAAWFAGQWWLRRRRRWGLILYPLLGVGLGLVLHPHFPHNLLVWKVQSLDYFAHRDVLDVGVEIFAQTTDRLLTSNLAWLLGLLLVWRAAAPAKRGSDEPVRFDRVTADLLWVTAAAFTLLYLLGMRFSTYAVPFLTLAVAWELRARGLRVGRWASLAGGRRSPAWALALLIVLLSVLQTGRLFAALTASPDGAVAREDDWERFGHATPAGARVVAEWGSTHHFMLWAPQAIYTNVLEPLFMALPYPEAYAAQRAVFAGDEPDVPRALVGALASDHLAISRYHPRREALRRLIDDPRWTPVYSGHAQLFAVTPGHNDAFVLDWTVVGNTPPIPYPRAATAAERAVEGYVDVTRVGVGSAAGPCVALAHHFTVEKPETRSYAMAPWGPTELWLDDEPLVASKDTPRAFLTDAVTIPLRLTVGEHRLTVRTCRGDDGSGRAGFFLRRGARSGDG